MRLWCLTLDRIFVYHPSPPWNKDQVTISGGTQVSFNILLAIVYCLFLTKSNSLPFNTVVWMSLMLVFTLRWVRLNNNNKKETVTPQCFQRFLYIALRLKNAPLPSLHRKTFVGGQSIEHELYQCCHVTTRQLKLN